MVGKNTAPAASKIRIVPTGIVDIQPHPVGRPVAVLPDADLGGIDNLFVFIIRTAQ